MMMKTLRALAASAVLLIASIAAHAQFPSPTFNNVTIGGTLGVTGASALAGGTLNGTYAGNPTFSGNPIFLNPFTFGTTHFGTGSNNIFTITPGASSGAQIMLSQSGTGGVALTAPFFLTGAGTALNVTHDASIGGIETVGSGSNNILTLTPGAASGNPVTLSASGASIEMAVANVAVDLAGSGMVIRQSGGGNTLSLLPAAASGTALQLQESGTGGIAITTIGASNNMTLVPGASSSTNFLMSLSGSGKFEFGSAMLVDGSGTFGTTGNNALVITPGTAGNDAISFSQSGSGGVSVVGPVTLASNLTHPIIFTGGGAIDTTNGALLIGTLTSGNMTFGTASSSATFSNTLTSTASITVGTNSRASDAIINYRADATHGGSARFLSNNVEEWRIESNQNQLFRIVPFGGADNVFGAQQVSGPMNNGTSYLSTLGPFNQQKPRAAGPNGITGNNQNFASGADIQPPSISLTNPIQINSFADTATVTWANCCDPVGGVLALTTESWVNIQAGSPSVGGLVWNGWYQVKSLPTVNTFTIQNHASWRGTVSGTTMTVNQLYNGYINVATGGGSGMLLSGAGITPSTFHVLSQSSGTPGGAGVYVLDGSLTISTAEHITGLQTATSTQTGGGATVITPSYSTTVNSRTAMITSGGAGGFPQQADFYVANPTFFGDSGAASYTRTFSWTVGPNEPTGTAQFAVGGREDDWTNRGIDGGYSPDLYASGSATTIGFWMGPSANVPAWATGGGTAQNWNTNISCFSGNFRDITYVPVATYDCISNQAGSLVGYGHDPSGHGGVAFDSFGALERLQVTPPPFATHSGTSTITVTELGKPPEPNGSLVYIHGAHTVSGVTFGSTTSTLYGITKANPGVVNVPSHGFTTGQTVMLSGVDGMTQVNGVAYTITVVDANNFSIGVDTSGYGTYTGGGAASSVYTVANVDFVAQTFDITGSGTAGSTTTGGGANEHLSWAARTPYSSFQMQALLLHGITTSSTFKSLDGSIIRTTPGNGLLWDDTTGVASINSTPVSAGNIDIRAIAAGTGQIRLSSPLALSDSGTTLITTSTTIPVTYQVALIDSTSGALAETIQACNTGKKWDQTFIDAGGAAATHNITLTPTAGLVNGAANLVIAINRQVFSVHSNGNACYVY